MVLLCVRPLYVDYSRVTDCPGLHTRPKLARWWGQEGGERREQRAGQRDRPLREGAREERAEGWTEGQAS